MYGSLKKERKGILFCEVKSYCNSGQKEGGHKQAHRAMEMQKEQLQKQITQAQRSSRPFFTM